MAGVLRVIFEWLLKSSTLLLCAFHCWMIDGHDQDSYEEWEALGDDSRVPCPIEVHTKVYLKRCTITLWVRDVSTNRQINNYHILNYTQECEREEGVMNGDHLKDPLTIDMLLAHSCSNPVSFEEWDNWCRKNLSRPHSERQPYRGWELFNIQLHCNVFVVRARLISGKNEPSLYEISDWIVQDC